MTFFENITNLEKKKELAKIIVDRVKDGDVIGVGSGSTSYVALCQIAQKVKTDNLNITAIPTSLEMKMQCAALNIPTMSLLEKKPDWCFDGADEVDPNNWLIKGRGAAMFKEKLNIKNSKEVYILVDDSKIVTNLCEKCPIPVECFPDSMNYVREQIEQLGAKSVSVRLAEAKDGPIITENGNFILDVYFDNVDEDLEIKLKSIVGVIETGLFIGYPNIIIKKI